MHIHLFYTFLHNSSEVMFLCLPEELYILSAFFVSHIHSDSSFSILFIFKIIEHDVQEKTKTSLKHGGQYLLRGKSNRRQVA